MAGVAYLELMLSARTPLTKEEFESSDKGQVAQLLLEGMGHTVHTVHTQYTHSTHTVHTQYTQYT